MLAIARYFDSIASGIRARVKARTPKRSVIGKGAST